METVKNVKIAWLNGIVLALLVVVVGFLCFYKLGNQSLHPWDEAWYAAISRNLVRDGNPLDLQFNQMYFWDHPPLGFYLTALSFKLMGVSEFAARAPQALLSIVTVVLAYITGKQLRNRWVGLVAALIIVSSRWFLFRSRTGNLDILLTCTQLAFFYTALTTKFHQKLWLPASMFALALLSKTTIAVTLAPLLLLAYYERHQVRKIARKEVAVALISFACLFTPWYIFNAVSYGPKFLIRTVFEVGLRKGSASGVSLASLKQTFLYFHAAVHKWFNPFVLSLPVSILATTYYYSKKQLLRARPFSWALLYTLLAGFPFLLSAKTEIWHLIPIIPPMAFLIALSGTEVVELIHKQLPKSFEGLGIELKKKTIQTLLNLGYAGFTVLIMLLATLSVRSYWDEFINLSPSISEAAQVSSSVPTKNLPLYLTNDAFHPTIVYYADLYREVDVIRDYEFADICATATEPFLFITDQSFLDKTTGWHKHNQVGNLILVEFKNGNCGPTFWKRPI